MILKSIKEKYNIMVKEIINANMEGIIDGLDVKTENTLILLSKVLPLERMLYKYKDVEECVEERNKSLKSVWLVSIIGLVIMLIMALMWKRERMNMGGAIIEILIVVGVVGVVIYKFFVDDMIEYSKIIISEEIERLRLEKEK